MTAPQPMTPERAAEIGQGLTFAGIALAVLALIAWLWRAGWTPDQGLVLFLMPGTWMFLCMGGMPGMVIGGILSARAEAREAHLNATDPIRIQQRQWTREILARIAREEEDKKRMLRDAAAFVDGGALPPP